MSKKYYNGDKVLLYVRFFDNNSNIQSVVEEPRVRILHENKGELYEDLEWTPLKKMGEGEYYNKFTIPFDADNGIYNIIYSGILNGEEVKTIEEFHVVRKSEHYSNAIKVYGYIDESYSNKPLDDVNISISSYDEMYYTESNTSFDGKWETYLYPGEYLINFEKEGYELLSTSFELGTDSKEIQFNNITLKSNKRKLCGEGICEVSDSFCLKNGIPLDGLEVSAYDIEDIDTVCATCKTNNKGEFKIFLDPGFYILKVIGNSMNEDFNKSFRLRIDDDCEYDLEDMENNKIKPPVSYMSNGDGPIDYQDVLLDKMNNPISDAQINIIVGNRIIAECYTDLTGRYIFHLYHGKYTVRVYHPNFTTIPDFTIII